LRRELEFVSRQREIQKSLGHLGQEPLKRLHSALGYLSPLE
jgi:hypothetical protein